MKIYLLSLGAGLLVGVLYGLINVRSPAPPVVALVGLLGILAGEQIPAYVKQWLGRQEAGLATPGAAPLTGTEAGEKGNRQTGSRETGGPGAAG